MLKLIGAFFLVAICSSPVAAQSIQKIDRKMCYYIDKINHKYSPDSADFYDAYNDSLQGYLVGVLKKNPSTLEANFPNANKKYISIASSSDKKFRIYSWNQNGSGTMQGYSSVLQYKTPGGVNAARIYPLHSVGVDMLKDTGAPGMRYTDVYTVKTNDDKDIYLVIGRSIEATGLYYYEIKAYAIDGDRIDDKILLFKTREKRSNGIGYEVELSSKDLEKPGLPEIHFSKDMASLYIPVVTQKQLKLTNNYLVYKFDGNNYVFDKKAK